VDEIVSRLEDSCEFRRRDVLRDLHLGVQLWRALAVVGDGRVVFVTHRGVVTVRRGEHRRLPVDDHRDDGHRCLSLAVVAVAVLVGRRERFEHVDRDAVGEPTVVPGRPQLRVDQIDTGHLPADAVGRVVVRVRVAVVHRGLVACRQFVTTRGCRVCGPLRRLAEPVGHRPLEKLRFVHRLRRREKHVREVRQEVWERLDVVVRRLDVHTEVPLREPVGDTVERYVQVRPESLGQRCLVQPRGVQPERVERVRDGEVPAVWSGAARDTVEPEHPSQHRGRPALERRERPQRLLTAVEDEPWARVRHRTHLGTQVVRERCGREQVPEVARKQQFDTRVRTPVAERRRETFCISSLDRRWVVATGGPRPVG